MSIRKPARKAKAAGVLAALLVSAPLAGAASDEVSEALAEFVGRIAGAEAALRSQPAFGSEVEQARGYLQLVRALIKALEAEVLQDPDYPYFRILDFWLREGGDNPDQRYAFSPIRGGETYRIWGTLGSARRIELQLYAGQPWAGTGRSAGYLAFEDIELSPDGSFEIQLAAEAREGTWLRNPPDATTVFARHVYDEWDARRPGEIHIDRMGYEGRRRPEWTPADVARKLQNAAHVFEKTATTWPAFVQKRYVEGAPPNTLRELVDTYALGGARGRWMSGGHYALTPGKALLIVTPATSAHYQAIQLTDLWFASLEYGNRISSLTTKQSLRSPDGNYYTVISQEDPGHANWLDAGELPRGTFLLRYDGVQGAIPKEQHPSARLVELDQLPELIPGFTRVSEAERTRTRAARRRHLQLRSGR